VTFKAYFPRKVAKRIRTQLKTVLSAAGTVRDCDIAAKILLESDQQGATSLHRHVRAQRKNAEKSPLNILKTVSFRKRVSKWCDELKLDTPNTDFNPDEVRALASRNLPRLAQRFFEAGGEAAAHNSGEKLHAFRILAKKFRYTLELFLSFYRGTGEELPTRKPAAACHSCRSGAQRRGT